MFTSQLWAPKPQKLVVPTMERPGMIPGTWLQLSPETSPSCNPNKYVQLTPTASPLPSPSLKAENASSIDLNELSIADKPERYLSNHSSVSRNSSVSSNVSTRAPAFLAAPSVERREVAVSRMGGIGAAFLSN